MSRCSSLLLTLCLSLAFTLTHSTQIIAAEPKGPLLFHSSFDAPSADSSETYPTADFAVGRATPWPSKRVQIDEDGKFGEAALVDGNACIGIDTANNLRCERGTIAFWFKTTGDPSTWDTYTITIYGRPMHLYEYAFLRQNFDGRNPEQPDLWTVTWEKGDWHGGHLREWPADTWRHIAIGWDVLHGWKVYLDGELQTTTSNPFWPERILGRLGIGGEVSAHHIVHRNITVKSYDEFYIFDRSLTQSEIQNLISDNKPPTDLTPPPDPRAWLAWRKTEVGLQDSELPTLVCGKSVNKATYSFARFAKTVGRMSYLPFDGKKNTMWPLAYQGYCIGKDELVVHLEEGSRANWIQVKGDFRGILAAGTKSEIHLTDKDLPERAAYTRWRQLPHLLTEKDIRIKHEDMMLDEIAFVQLEIVDRPHVQGEQSLRLSGPVQAIEEVKRRYQEWDQTTVRATHGTDPSREEGKTLKVPAGRMFHVQTKAVTEDTDVGMTLWNIGFEKLPANTRVHLELIDPVYEIRTLCTFEGQITDDGIGQKRLNLLIDHKDIKLREGRRLWWSLCFDQDVVLRLGGRKGSKMILYPSGKGSNEFVWDQMFVMRAEYNFVSEGEPSQHYGNPRHDYRSLDEILTIAEDILHYDPTNEFARAVWYRTGRSKPLWSPEAQARHPDLPEEQYDISLDGAPRWAAVGRAALKQVRRLPDWWIDHRQAPNGEFGSRYDDDTDLMGDFVGFALIGDPNGKIARAIDKLNDFVWHHSLTNGVNILLADMNHAYEEGSSILRINAMLHYGEPTRFERLYGVTRFLNETLTGINSAGHRHFRSFYFSAKKILTNDAYGVDLGSSNFFEPATYIYWYNGHPLPLRLIKEFGEAWLDHDQGDGRFGGLPVEYETDKPPRTLRMLLAMENVLDTYYFLYEQTGDEKYNSLVFDNVPHGRSPKEYVVFKNPYTRFASYYRLLKERGVDTTSIDQILRDKAKSGTLQWMITGDRNHLIDQLEEAYRYMRREAPMVTWAGLAADRVGVKGQIPLSYMYLGGIASMAKWSTYWYHAVSWTDADDDIARFVIDQGDEKLKVLLYSFHDKPIEIGMRVWRIVDGDYSVRIGVDENLDDQIDSDLEKTTLTLRRASVVPIPLPPRQQVVVELKLIRRRGDIRDRPDLAIGSRDVNYDEQGKTLTVTVHNIGAKDSPPSEIELTKNGKPLARQKIPSIAAPRDLLPKTVKIRFDDLQSMQGVTIHLDRAQEIDEITEVNNLYTESDH